MSGVGPAEIVGIDAAEAVEAAADVDGTLHSLVEFNHRRFNTLYVSEATRGLYDSDEEMTAHFERIHDYVNIDFTEAELFTNDLFPMADRVRYKATALDVLTIVRLYLDDQRGLFVAVERGDPVERLVNRLEDVAGGS